MLRVIKEHGPYLGVLLVLSLVFWHTILGSNMMMNNVHHINDVAFISQNLKESLSKHGELHLWTPYYYSGRPLYAQPEYYFLDLNLLFMFLLGDIHLAMNWSTILYFFLAGLGMYLVFYGFVKNKWAALVAGITYQFSGYFPSFVMSGNLNVLAGYALIPFAFYFYVQALHNKNKITPAILSGVFIALQLYVGGTLLIPYEMVAFGVYGLVFLLGPRVVGKAITLGIVLAIIFGSSYGLAAIKLLPGLEFMSLSNRGHGVGFQEYLGYPIEFKNIGQFLISHEFLPGVSGGISGAIGFVGFALALAGLAYWKKRYVLFSIGVLFAAIMMAKQGWVSEFLYTLPVFGQLRHIERAVFLIAFVLPILAATGLIVLTPYIKKYTKPIIGFSIVIVLLIIELMIIPGFPPNTEIIRPEEIPINEIILSDPDQFRTYNHGLEALVGASGYNYLAQAGIGTIKGGGGIWFNDYLTHLSIVQQQMSSKLWGMLNNKYIISDELFNHSRLPLIGEYSPCDDCAVWEAYGPYLYENLDFLPRAYTVSNSVVVVGPPEAVFQNMYSLLLNPAFDPKTLAVFRGRNSISEYQQSELNQFDAVILTSGPNTVEQSMLQNFVSQGGQVLPDIFNQQFTLEQQDLLELLDQSEEGYEEVSSTVYEHNKVVYDTQGKQGVLVLAERFSNFPGWYAWGEQAKPIYMVNGITTAVFLDGDPTITFRYSPAPYVKGKWISLLTLIIISGVLIMIWRRSRK